ncbi:MAG: peptidoglycan-binding protein [Sedimentisphaerales bacterium]|nr:peptidoglycan-binding protein [Sedimentisphaerales bacterium]
MDRVNKEETSQTIGKGPAGKEGYTVKQGDCIESLAYEHGLFWETVWNDPKNAELKRERKNPNVLLPGDKVFIREKEEKDVPGATEKKHRFKRKGVPSKVKITLRKEGEPRANQPYMLEIEGETFKGKTDGKGKLEQEVPPDAQQGKLTVGEGEEKTEHILKFRYLDPVDEVSGAQQRLNNMGYDAGKADGKMNPKTSLALQEFQSQNKLKVTGKLDQATADKLKEVHDK